MPASSWHLSSPRSSIVFPDMSPDTLWYSVLSQWRFRYTGTSISVLKWYSPRLQGPFHSHRKKLKKKRRHAPFGACILLVRCTHGLSLGGHVPEGSCSIGNRRYHLKNSSIHCKMEKAKVCFDESLSPLSNGGVAEGLLQQGIVAHIFP